MGAKMGRTVTLRLDAQTGAQLDALSDALGFSEEMAAVYAIRLVGACMREGLLEDMPARAWPREADVLTAAMGKVIAFPFVKAADAESRA